MPILRPMLFLAFSLFCWSCRSAETPKNIISPTPVETFRPSPSPTSSVPNLQAELLDNRNKTTSSPIGSFDFKNFTYELPRGWQNPDGTAEITLTNGRIAPYQGPATNEEMSDEEKAEIRQKRRIGMSYVTTKYLDVTGDAQ